jgi:SAM-dependent methyltransferase
MPDRSDELGEWVPAYDEHYYRDGYGAALEQRLPRVSREQYWARWLRRTVGAGAPVLDLGAGLGWFAERARAAGLHAICLDVSEFSAHHLSQRSFDTVVASAQSIPTRPSVFDAVVALDVLEHLGDPMRALGEVRRVLRHDGVLVISVPNTEGIGARSKRERGTWFAQRDPTHTALWDPGRWTDAVEAAGLRIDRVGTDALWDVPYPGPVPTALQRAVLVPAHRVLSRSVGMLRWRRGDNVVIVGRAA